ncbi:MAG: Y-family DNA polymerase [Eubacteriales bacterium]
MRLIAHIFIYNFFVTAALADNPDIAGSPVAVAKKNRIIDVSPEAAAGGVFPGLTRRHASQTCPSLKLVEFQAHTYKERTAELAGQCYNLSPRVETPAENEAFIDLSGKKPPTVQVLSGLVKGLIPGLGGFATVSLAPCRLLARAAALQWLSPAHCTNAPVLPGLAAKAFDTFRLCVVKQETAGEFASQLPVEMMWPLETAVIKRLKFLGLNSFSDVSGIPPTLLHRQFDSLAPAIADYSRGIDKTNIPVFHPPDRIIYHTYCGGADRLQLETVLKQAAVYIVGVLQERGQSCRELALSVFFEDCPTETKTSSFTRGKYDTSSVYYNCMNLLNKAGLNGTVTEISLAAGQLTANRHSQLTLFEDPKNLNSQAPDHKGKLAAVCLSLGAKYAPGVITMGKALPVSRREQMLMFVDPLRSR